MTTVSLRMDITRTESWNAKEYRFDIDYTVTNSHGSDDEEGGLDWLSETIFCMEMDCHPLPSACYSMKVGDRLIVAATLSVSWPRDWYTGEYDEKVVYEAERTLSRRRFSKLTRKQKKAYYIPKGDRRGNVP